MRLAVFALLLLGCSSGDPGAGSDLTQTESVAAGQNALDTTCTSASTYTSSNHPIQSDWWTSQVGSLVTFHNAAAGCSSPEFAIYMATPSSSYTLVAPFSTANANWVWDTSTVAPGVYYFYVYARGQGSTVTPYEAYAWTNYVVLAQPTCTSLGVSASPTHWLSEDPYRANAKGTVVTFNASTTGCSTPEFRIMHQPPGEPYKEEKGWSASNSTWVWDTANESVGIHNIQFLVRAQGSTAAYEWYTGFSYRVLASPTCDQFYTAFTPYKWLASNQELSTVGTQVTLTSTVQGCATAEYAIYKRAPGASAYTLLAPYSTANSTFVWNTQGEAPGVHQFWIQARAPGSTLGYESFYAPAYNLLPSAMCENPAVALSAPSGHAAVGTTVTVTPTATGCPAPRFKYWIAPPGGGYQQITDWAAQPLTWQTTAHAAGTYWISVWYRNTDSTAYYEAYKNFPFVIDPAPNEICTSASTSASPASNAAAVGQSITVTNTASGCSGPEFQIFRLGTNGSWQAVTQYSPSNSTWIWNTTGETPGWKSFMVLARSQGAQRSSDAVSYFDYFLQSAPSCTSLTASASPANGSVGTNVVLTSTSSGCASTPLYRINHRRPNNVWTFEQEFSASAATWQWDTTNEQPGWHTFEVNVRSQGSTLANEGVYIFDYYLQSGSGGSGGAGGSGGSGGSGGTGGSGGSGGSGATGGGNSDCGLHFEYAYDEVGRLVNAQRFQGSAVTANLQYTYDYNDDRVIKADLTAEAAQYAVYPLDTVELRGTAYDDTVGDFIVTADTEAPYLIANGVRIGRVVVEPPSQGEPRLASDPSARRHTFLEIGDHLGSTSIVIDKASGELVERTTYQPYGATESDYRPARWKGFREDYRFTGKEEDIEVGLTYFGKRFLSASLGRWVSPDPLAVHEPIAGADLNLYAYVRGATLKSVDPLGLVEFDVSVFEDDTEGKVEATRAMTKDIAVDLKEEFGIVTEQENDWGGATLDLVDDDGKQASAKADAIARMKSAGASAADLTAWSKARDRLIDWVDNGDEVEMVFNQEKVGGKPPKPLAFAQTSPGNYTLQMNPFTWFDRSGSSTLKGTAVGKETFAPVLMALHELGHMPSYGCISGGAACVGPSMYIALPGSSAFPPHEVANVKDVDAHVKMIPGLDARGSYAAGLPGSKILTSNGIDNVEVPSVRQLIEGK